jgi:8-oxo-dGTP pyrophosphatase MutT (NUDIX family)
MLMNTCSQSGGSGLEKGENPWQTLARRRVYENPWFSVREDRVIRPDGGEGVYGVVELPPSVGVVAVDDAGLVWLVGQWRYCLGRFSWEIPTGSCGADEDSQAAAKRELEEEVGLRAGVWRSLGAIDNSNAVTTDQAHLFLAMALEYVGSHPEPVEKITCRRVPLDDCVAMVMDGRITDSTSIAAILKADRVLGLEKREAASVTGEAPRGQGEQACQRQER